MYNDHVMHMDDILHPKPTRNFEQEYLDKIRKQNYEEEMFQNAHHRGELAAYRHHLTLQKIKHECQAREERKSYYASLPKSGRQLRWPRLPRDLLKLIKEETFPNI